MPVGKKLWNFCFWLIVIATPSDNRKYLKATSIYRKLKNTKGQNSTNFEPTLEFEIQRKARPDYDHQILEHCKSFSNV